MATPLFRGSEVVRPRYKPEENAKNGKFDFFFDNGQNAFLQA